MYGFRIGSQKRMTRLDLLKRGDDLNEELRQAIEEWLPVREKTIPKLREIADTIDKFYKDYEHAQRAQETNRRVRRCFAGFFQCCVTYPDEPSLSDQIMATATVTEAQKQIDDDHVATQKVLGTISDIRDLVNRMTHLKTQARRNEMLSILLDISPGRIADIANEMANNVEDIGREIANAGKQIFDFGETAFEIGRVAAYLGEKAGWIPVVGSVASEVEDAGETAQFTGSVAMWVGELLEDIGDATATASTHGALLVHQLDGDTPTEDIDIQITLFPLNIEQMVSNGVTASATNELETNVSQELREQATMYETQMKSILTAVNADTPQME